MSCSWDFLAKLPPQFCEEQQCSWIVQPGNTASNIIYILVGLVILASSYRRNASFSPFGFFAFTVGVCSTIFHMSFSQWGGSLDVGSIALIAAYMLGSDLRRLGLTRGVGRTVTLLVFPLFFAEHWLAIHVHYLAGACLIGVFSMSTLAIHFYTLHKLAIQERRFLCLTIVSFLIAFAFLLLDNSGWACDPKNHFFQVHMLWHAFTALSIYFIYKHHEIAEAELVKKL